MRWILPLVYFFIVTQVAALTVTTTNIPASVDKDQEIQIDVSLVCSGCGDSYLRGVFFSSGINYFGLTQNNQGQWIGTTSDKTQYFKVSVNEVIEGSWSGKLKMKPDADDSSYTGPGSYFLKVGRYTSSGSVTWSGDTALAITGATPTQTPTSTPIHTPTSTQIQSTGTPTPSSQPPAAPTSTSTLVVSKSPTPKKSPMPIVTANVVASETGSVLGTAMSPTSNDSTGSGVAKPTLPLIVALLFVATGFLILALVLIIKKRHEVSSTPPP